MLDFCFICFCTVIEEFEINSMDFAFQKTRVKTSKAIFVFYKSLVAESPGFTGLGAPSLPGFPVSPLPGQCINSQPWLQALTNRVAPLMRGRSGRQRRRARATGLSRVGPLWAGAEAA